MAAGAIVRAGGTQLPRLAGLFKNVLRPAARFMEKYPGRTTAAIGAGQGFLNEGIGGIPGGAVAGGLWGMGMGGHLKGAVAPITKGLTKVGVNPGLAKNLGAVLPSAGLAGLTLTPTIGNIGRGITGGAQAGGGNVLGAGATQMTREGNLIPMSVLPEGYRPDSNNMVRGPQGNWWYYYNPGGVPAGNRLNSQLEAITQASNINTIGNALFGQTERVQRAEFERQAAAEQLAANIDQAKQMALATQGAGLKMGIDAGQAMATGMGQRSNFRYF